METLNILIAIPIGLIYNIIIHKIGEIFNSDLEYKNKIQKNLLLSFGGGIIALFAATQLFAENKKYESKPIKYGFYLGAFLLLFHSLFYNWKTMENNTKFIVMIITLAILISYTYTYTKTFSSKKNNKKYDKYETEYNLEKKDNYLPATLVSYPTIEPMDDERTDFDEIINY